MKTVKIPIGGRIRVCPQDVIAFVGSINYSLIYTQDGEVRIVATTLKNLENKFKPHHFFRSHKSFLINLNYVVHYNPIKLQFVEMKNHLKVAISRRKRAFFLEQLNGSN
jgi:two-component system, LytTR family, response regulator